MRNRDSRRISMVLSTALLVSVALVASPACNKRGGSPGGAAPNDWVQRIEGAYGGRETFERTRSLAFDFVSYEDRVEKARFHHVMSLRGGACVYETDAAIFAHSPFLDDQTHTWKPIGLQLPAGRLTARIDRSHRTGEVRVDGALQADTLVRRVIERINNDSFWLLLPFQLEDPGVRLTETGPVTLPDGRAAVALALGFGTDAGATPADRWTLYVDPSTSRILKSRVDMQNSTSFVEAEWHGSVKTGGLDLADERTIGKRTIRFERLSASAGGAG